MFQFRPFPSYTYLIQCTMSEYCSDGFPHSEIHGYNGYLLLPVAYRSLSRPSSAPDAKAFPLRSFQLDLFEIFGSHLVELCRQFNGSSLSKLLPSSLRCSTIKTNYLLLPCLSLFSLFSFQGTTSTEASYRSQPHKRDCSFTSLCLLFLADPLSLGSARSAGVFWSLKPD